MGEDLTSFTKEREKGQSKTEIIGKIIVVKTILWPRSHVSLWWISLCLSGHT